MIKIKHRITGAVLYAVEAETLAGAYLSGADLSRAGLCRADLSGAYLYGAKLSDADLRGANLSDAKLSAANLYGAGLSSAKLGGTNLSGADLRGADLRGAKLSRAALGGADLNGADLGGADLTGTCLDPVNTPNADVAGFELDADGYVVGYRTAGSPTMGGPGYEIGRRYESPWFSTAPTECHPGIYLFPTVAALRQFARRDAAYLNQTIVQVRTLPEAVHHAGTKWRARWIEVVQTVGPITEADGAA